MKINNCAVVTIYLIEDLGIPGTDRFSLSFVHPSIQWLMTRPTIRVHEREFTIPDPSEYRG